MSENTENKEWSNREMGALWVNVKQGSNEKYLTGQVNGEKVILFKNKFKDDNPKAPDFRIYKQKDQDQGGSKSSGKVAEEVEEVEEVDLI
jgi:uncharacterized protein (DUF736 family)